MKNSLTAQQAKVIWLGMLGEFHAEIFQKLYHIQFGKGGKMKENKNYVWVKKHFPNLLKIWEDKVGGVNNGR